MIDDTLLEISAIISVQVFCCITHHQSVIIIDWLHFLVRRTKWKKKGLFFSRSCRSSYCNYHKSVLGVPTFLSLSTLVVVEVHSSKCWDEYWFVNADTWSTIKTDINRRHICYQSPLQSYVCCLSEWIMTGSYCNTNLWVHFLYDFMTNTLFAYENTV